MSASARRDVLLAKESEEMIKPFSDAGNYEARVAYRKAEKKLFQKDKGRGWNEKRKTAGWKCESEWR